MASLWSHSPTVAGIAPLRAGLVTDHLILSAVSVITHRWTGSGVMCDTPRELPCGATGRWMSFPRVGRPIIER